MMWIILYGDYIGFIIYGVIYFFLFLIYGVL